MNLDQIQVNKKEIEFLILISIFAIYIYHCNNITRTIKLSVINIILLQLLCVINILLQLLCY